MKKFSKAASILCLAVCGIVTSAVASECKNVSGNIDETIIPAPNDPFGRTLVWCLRNVFTLEPKGGILLEECHSPLPRLWK